MAKSILSDALEIVEISRKQRESQKESVFRRELLLYSSYRTEALLETLLILFAEFADKLLTEKGDNIT